MPKMILTISQRIDILTYYLIKYLTTYLINNIDTTTPIKDIGNLYTKLLELTNEKTKNESESETSD